jgi:hypothetical protein
MRNWKLVLLALLLGFVSCDGGSGNPPDIGGDHSDGGSLDSALDVAPADHQVGEASQSGIYGDWFVCKDTQCSKLGIGGWRIMPDGKIFQMYADPPFLEPDEKYCYTHRPELNLTYTYANGIIKVVTYPDSTTFSLQVVPVGDFMDVKWLDLNKTDRWKRIIPVRDKGSCDKSTPWVCPDVKQSGSKSCSWKWICDNGDFSLDCAASKTGSEYECTCINAHGAVDGKFISADVCQTASIPGPIALTNLKCNWQLWFPPL